VITKGEMMQAKYSIEEGQMVDTYTGEIINTDEVKKAYQNDLLMKFLSSESNLQDIGETLGLRLVQDKKGNDHHVLNVKEGYHFVKVFKVALREVFSVHKVSKAAKATYLDFQTVTQFPTNSVVIDGESPTLDKLCEFLDLKKTRLYEILKELESADLIMRKKMNGQLVIYINPYIYCCGLVDYETLILFKDSQYNPFNR
jgi:hypothetical protein